MLRANHCVKIGAGVVEVDVDHVAVASAHNHVLGVGRYAQLGLLGTLEDIVFIGLHELLHAYIPYFNCAVTRSGHNILLVGCQLDAGHVGVVSVFQLESQVSLADIKHFDHVGEAGGK